MNMLTSINDKNALKVSQNELEFLQEDFRVFLAKYIADGSPRKDTIITYLSHIQQFAKWLNEKEGAILHVNKNTLIDYRNKLVNDGLQSSSIALKLSCIRRFYDVALAKKIIDDNPVVGVKAPKNRTAEQLTGAKYISAGKLEFLFACIDEKESLENLRAKCIIALMSLQGLRTVEVHRLSQEDVDFEKGLLLVKGKGRDRYIAPREDVLKLVKRYITMRFLEEITPEDAWGTPVFTSMSNNNRGKRMSRCGIRDVVDYWFIKIGIRKKGDKSGKSCHLLRHTTGALLYQATHDLLVVQKELGHADPKTTSKYAHIQDILEKRHTTAIPVSPL